MRWRWTVPLAALALLAVLAAAGPAQAQEVCQAPTVTITPDSVEMGPDGSRSLLVTVSNTNSFQGNAEIGASVPAGWDANLNRSSFTVPAGGQATANLTVTAPSQGTGVTQGQAEVAATLTCGSPPLSQTSGEGTATASVSYQATDLPWLAIVGAGVVLVGGGVGVVVYRNRQLKVELDCPRPLQEIEPGGRASFPVTVANRRAEPETVDLQVLDVPDDWRAFVAVPRVELEAREERDLWLMVKAPPGADEGDSITVTLEAVPVRGERGERVAIRLDVVSPEDAPEFVPPDPHGDPDAPGNGPADA